MTKEHTAERTLLALLRIEDDGVAYWTESPGRRVAAGAQAGSVCKLGYVVVQHRRKLFKLHRLIFLHHHGYLPEMVDHIDGNPTNNRVSNLRAATRVLNMRNARRPANNTSGVKNVYWHRPSSRWLVTLRVERKSIYFGCFLTLEEATAVAEQARVDTFGEFARHA